MVLYACDIVIHVNFECLGMTFAVLLASFRFADVISFNDYPGWYTDIGDIDAIKSELNKAVEWARSNFPEKGVTIYKRMWSWCNLGMGQFYRGAIVSKISRGSC